MAASRYPSAAMAAGVTRQRTPPSRPLRSTDDSRIIDRRGTPGPAPTMRGQLMPPAIGFGEDVWQQLARRYAALQIQQDAARNANPGRLPQGGSLYPPGMSMARGGTTSGMW
jgi:hypothetical protein